MGEIIPLHSEEVEALGKKIQTVQKGLQASSPPRLQNVLDLSERLMEVAERTMGNYSSDARSLSEEKDQLIHRIETLEDHGMRNDLSLLEEVHEVRGILSSLSLEWVFLPPDEICQEIKSLEDRLQNLTDKVKFCGYNAGFLEGEIDKTFQILDHLEFRYHFPIAEELNEHSYQSNFMYRLIKIKEDLKKGKSATFAPELDVVIFKKARTKKDKIKAIDAYIVKLKQLTLLAETFLYGNPGIALQVFRSLDKDVQKGIDQILWKFKGRNVSQLFGKNVTEEASSVMAQAIMGYVQDNIMGA